MLQFEYLCELPVVTVTLAHLRRCTFHELVEMGDRELATVASMVQQLGLGYPRTPLEWRAVAKALGVDIERRIPRLTEIEAAAASRLLELEHNLVSVIAGAQRKRNVSLADAETLVRDWLMRNAAADPSSVRRDVIASELNISGATVSRTRAWRAFQRRRRELRSSARREVPLTSPILATLPSKSARPDELAQLIEEQRRDMMEHRSMIRPR